MAAVVVSHLGKTAVVTDIKDPGVQVIEKGTPQTVTGPDKQSVALVPGGAAPEQNASSPTVRSAKHRCFSRRTPTHEERTAAADLLRPGSIWAGKRSYRRGTFTERHRDL